MKLSATAQGLTAPLMDPCARLLYYLIRREFNSHPINSQPEGIEA